MRFLTLIILMMLAFPACAEEVQAFRGFKRLKQPIPVSTLQVITPQGATASLGQFHGQWVLMNAWASWCAPCVAELPTLNSLAAQSSLPNLKILAVSFDASKTQEEVKAYLKQRNISDFAAYMDVNHGLEQALKAQGLPVTYLINPDGNVIANYRGGANWSDPKVLQALSFFVNSGTTSNKSATKP